MSEWVTRESEDSPWGGARGAKKRCRRGDASAAHSSALQHRPSKIHKRTQKSCSKNQLSAYKSMICNPAITMQNAVPRQHLHPHAATRSTAPLENSSSNADQRSLSCATSDQRPLPCIKFTRTSSHRAIVLPGARNPPTGCQSSIHVVHLPSLRRATWPAHRHFRLLCAIAQSETLP